MDLGIKNKRVLVTGASRGIGEEIANQFAKEGCHLTLIARNHEKLEKMINKYGGKEKGHNYFAADLNEPGAPSKIAKKILEDFKNIDIVVHNVGGALRSKNIFCDVKEWMKVWAFNVGIAIEMNNIFVPKMKENKWGRVIHISSLNAVTGGTTSDGEAAAPAYTCAKSFLNMYTKVLGREVAKDNVIVSAVMPGVMLFEGKYWDRLSKENPKLIKNYLHNHHAIKRFGKASEIAPFVLLLASTHASFAAASIVPVDGGYI